MSVNAVQPTPILLLSFKVQSIETAHFSIGSLVAVLTFSYWLELGESPGQALSSAEPALVSRDWLSGLCWQIVMACSVGACGPLAGVINRMEGRGLGKHHVLSIFHCVPPSVSYPVADATPQTA